MLAEEREKCSGQRIRKPRAFVEPSFVGRKG